MEDILKLFKERESSRCVFDPDRPIKKPVLRQILKAARWAPTAHNMQNFEIVVVDDKGTLNELSQVANPISATFIKENYLQLAFSEEELKQKKAGVLADNFPPTWKTPEAQQGIIAGGEAPQPLGQPVQAGPVMLIVTYDPARRAPASEGDFLGAVSLGCVMENLWLMASSLGVGFHIMSVLSNAPVEKEVKRILKIPENLKIAFSCRLGYPASKPAGYLRVRRGIEDFAHHNSYGSKGLD